MNECKIVAVLNRKGGVCKTTTTHNLGVALVQRGYRVLLVDCDTQRNLSISLGLNRPDEECYTLCELLQPLIDVEVDEVDIQNCIHHLENGVDFIPNKQALSTVEKQISTLDFRRECILFDALEDVRLDYDYILLDCMASLGMLAVNVMMACDTVLLVSTPEEDSIEGLELASDFIQEAARALRKEIPVCGVLICRVDMRYRKSRSGVERIRQLFVPQYPIYQEMIPDRVCVADARNKQVSIIEYAPESEPARAHQVVCDSFVKEVEYHGIHTA